MQRYLVLGLSALLALAVYKVAAIILDRRRHAGKLAAFPNLPTLSIAQMRQNLPFMVDN